MPINRQYALDNIVALCANIITERLPQGDVPCYQHRPSELDDVEKRSYIIYQGWRITAGWMDIANLKLVVIIRLLLRQRRGPMVYRFRFGDAERTVIVAHNSRDGFFIVAERMA